MSPEDPTEAEQQARAYFAAGDFASAEELFRKLAQGAPHSALAQYNWGVALGKLDRADAAMQCYRRTIELNPHFADAYTNFANCLNDMNKIPLARQGFALARQLAPDNPVPVINEAIAALALGDYVPGWKDFTARWRLPAYAKFRRDYPQPYWRGEDIGGRTLFVFAEQGFGDTLQMARYIPLLIQKGVRVVVEAQPATARLLRSLAGAPQVIAKGDPVPAFDVYCSFMDLPLAFGTLPATIPATFPYLFADTAETEFFRRKLDTNYARHIGLCWGGRPSHENDRNRSLSFAQLQPLIDRDDIEWISLQRLVPDADAGALALSRVRDWKEHFNDFSATAAAIAALDLVITVDTAVAHLAGALGKPVWVLLPFFADWRWMIDVPHTPWYPTARLFRQPGARQWGEVLGRVCAAL